jgi:hypothetical protein
MDEITNFILHVSQEMVFFFFGVFSVKRIESLMISIFFKLHFFCRIYTLKIKNFKKIPSFFCHQVRNLHPKKITAYEPQLFCEENHLLL